MQKTKILFQYFCLLIAKVRTLLIFGSTTDTCNAMAQKINEWINYQPISLSNVSIHPIEHIEVKHIYFCKSAGSMKIDKGVNLFTKLQGHNNK